MGTKYCTKNFQDFQKAGNVLSWQNLSPRFSNGNCHENLDAVRQIICSASFPWGISIKHLKHKNAHGDCDAAIAKAAPAVTHALQSLSQRVGSGDEGLGLFGFDLSSAETGFCLLEEEQEGESKPIHGIVLGTWLQKKLEDLSAAPDEPDHACREAQKTSSHIIVFRMIYLCSSWKRPSLCFQYIPTTVIVLITQPS